MSIVNWLLDRFKSIVPLKDKSNESIDSNLKIAKYEAMQWWNKQSASRDKAQCDRCNAPIVRGQGCLAQSKYTSDLKIGTLNNPNLISGLLGSSPDLVCESCFKKYAAIGATWAKPWSKRDDTARVSPEQTKEEIRRRIEESRKKGMQKLP